MRLPTIRTVAATAAAAMTLTLAAACGDGGTDAADNKELTIPIATGWDEDVAVSNLFKVVLEKKGYDVSLQDMDLGVVFSGIQKGELDVFFDVWLPVSQADYWKKVKDDVEDLGVWYDETTLTFAVPKYMDDLDTIADLKGKAGEFAGTITGIDPGAGITRVTRKDAMPAYGLDDYTLKTSSTAAMLAALKKAIGAKDPIVVTLWHPHWAYSAFPIKDLKDPKEAMGGTQEIRVIARDGFSDDHPDLAAALKKFSMHDETLADLEEVVLRQHKDDPEAGAKAWLKEHPDFEQHLGL